MEKTDELAKIFRIDKFYANKGWPQSQWDILGLISSSFGAQKKCGYLKKDHILTTLMWSKCGHFIFQAHLGLISVSFGAQENVVKMWS